MADEKVDIEITAEASKALEGIKLAIVGLKNLAGMAGTIGAAYLVSRAAIDSFFNNIIKATNAAAAQESAEIGLTAALKNRGMATVGNINALTDYAEAMQRVTGVDSAEIIQAEKLLTTFGLSVDEVKKAIKASLDFAAAREGEGMSVRSAAILIGKAYQGQAEALARYGIQIDDSVEKSQKFNEVLKLMEKQFGGMAETSGASFTGSQRKLSSAIGDVVKEVGYFIIQSPLVRGGMDMTTNAAYALADALEQVRKRPRETIGFLIKEVERLSMAGMILGKALEDSVDPWGISLDKAREKLRQLNIEVRQQLDLPPLTSIMTFPESITKPPALKPLPKLEIPSEELNLPKFKSPEINLRVFPKMPTSGEIDAFIADLTKKLSAPAERVEIEKKELLEKYGESADARILIERNAASELDAIGRDLAQKQIGGIMSLQDASDLEKINFLTSMRDTVAQGTAEWGEFQDAIVNLTAGRSARELGLLQEQMTQEQGLREAQLAAHLGMLSETEAATIAHYDQIQELNDIKAEYLIASQTRISDFAKTTFAEVGTQGVAQFSNAIGRAVIFSDNLANSIVNIGKNMAAMIIQMGIQWLLMAAIGKVIALMGLKTQIAVGAGVAAAWSPAAFMRTIAELGPIAGPPTFATFVAALPGISAAVSAASTAGAAMGSAGVAMQSGGFTLGEGLAYLHPREIIAPEPKLKSIFKETLIEQGKNVVFQEGSIAIQVNGATSASEILDGLNYMIKDKLAEIAYEI